MADEFGEAALAQMQDTVLRPAHEDGSDLRLEATGEELDDAEPEAGDTGRDGVQPGPGKTGPLLKQAIQADRLERIDDGVLQRDGIPGDTHPEEQRDVTEHVTGAMDLEDDAPPLGAS